MADILKEVEIVGIEVFKTKEGSDMAKVYVLEDYPEGSGTSGRYGRQVGVDYLTEIASILPYANQLPHKVTLVKQMQRNNDMRDVLRLITVQDGWRTDKAVQNIANHKN